MSTGVQKSLRKLDKTIASKILDKFESELLKCSNPRQIGKPLKGELGNLWRYRIGDYRVVCDIKDDVLTIVVVRLGHRKEVYD